MVRVLSKSACDKYIKWIDKHYPDMCYPQDLVEMGIYRSQQAAFYSRSKGEGPEYFALPNRRIGYPKSGLMKYLRKVKSSGRPLQ
jgi:hypothetical protein